MPTEKNIKPNRGVILDKRPTDYVLGSSPVEKQVLMPSLNWKDYKPEHEIQAVSVGEPNQYDTSMCVSFSATDVIEYIFNHAIQTGRISQVDKDWLYKNGYFKNGFINFSERFVGALGDTTAIGAYQYKVGDAIRKFGLIPQDMFPMADNFQDNIDKKFITQEMYDLGAEFIKRFPISYEWANNRKEGLKYAPLQVCVYYADGDGILCPTNPPQHAVEEIFYTEDYEEIGDSYWREFKKYCHKAIYSAMLYTVKFNNMIFKKEKNNSDIYLINEEKKTKVMVVDMPTFEAIGSNFEEVDSLEMYKTNGSIIWANRIIN